MAALIYLLCALTCLTAFVLLLRGWLAGGSRLLFWSALCFAALTFNNVLLVIDRIVFPTQVDLSTWRLGAALVAIALLVYGLVSEEE